MTRMNFRKLAILTSTIALAALFSAGESAQARVTRIYVHPYPYYYNPYSIKTSDWYAVRAYYAGGPWSGIAGGGVPYAWNGWADYAARNGIGCESGSIVKGGDGIPYVCQ